MSISDPNFLNDPKWTKLEVVVSLDDIIGAKPGDGTLCPLAIGIKKYLVKGLLVYVGEAVIRIYEKNFEHNSALYAQLLKQDLQDFVVNFDNNIPIAPRTFQIELPTWMVAKLSDPQNDDFKVKEREIVCRDSTSTTHKLNPTIQSIIRPTSAECAGHPLQM